MSSVNLYRSLYLNYKIYFLEEDYYFILMENENQTEPKNTFANAETKTE